MKTNDSQKFFEEGNQFLQNAKYPEALLAFDKAIASDSTNAQAWCNRGIAFYHMEKYREAIESFEKSIVLDPRLAAWMNCVNFLGGASGRTVLLARGNSQAVFSI